MKITEISVEELDMYANTLKALAHPVRIAILSYLENSKRKSVTEIYEHLQLEQSVVSHHLKILKDNDIVVPFRDGKNTFYSLKHNNVSKILECINSCKKSE